MLYLDAILGRYDYIPIGTVCIASENTPPAAGNHCISRVAFFLADLLIPLDTQQQPLTGQARGIHVCTWILLHGRRRALLCGDVCNDPSLHALVLILLRSGALVASNDIHPAGIESWITAAIQVGTSTTTASICNLPAWVRGIAPPSGLKGSG